VIKVRVAAVAAASPAVVKAVAVDRAAAVRVEADPVVDSVAAVEAVKIADASLSYLQKRGERVTAHLFYFAPSS
jgi:hypothetical protein